MGSRRVVQLAALLLVLWVTCVYGQGNRKSCYKGQLRINERLGEYFQEKDSIFWRTLLDGTVLKHGTEIRQRCKRDYELFGGGRFLFPQRYFFSKNNGGVWDPELAVCKKKRCDIPDTYHGAVSYDDESVAQGKLLHGTDVTTTCDEGYEIKRGQTVEVNTCKKGQLPVPRCSEIECMVPNVTVLIPGEMVKQSYKHREEIRELTCAVGEELVGDSILVCQNDGTWHGTAACKQRVECIMPNVTALIPGEIVRKSYKPREEIRGLTCVAGEKLVGDSRLVCQDDVECHLPNVTARIRIAMVKQSYKPREEIRGLTCAAGEELVGDSRLVCQDDGTWHGTAACINDCAAPPAIPNTDVSDGGTLEGDTRTYTCSPGYVLRNAITLNITCQHNSAWSTPSFDCLRDCAAPPAIPNTDVSDGGTLEGDTRNYTCSLGYVLRNAITLNITCQHNSAWSTPSFDCLRGCAAPPAIPNTDVSDGGTLEGDTRSYTCSLGYVLRNAITLNITCQHNSAWSTPSFDCLRYCGAPPAIQNADVSDGGTLEGDTRTYTCSQGYVLRNAVTLDTTCQHNSAWSTPSFDCLRDCYEPPSFCKATLSKGDTLEGSTRNYTCIPESTVIATPVSTVCQPNGTWTTVDLKCYTGECPPLWQQIDCSCYIVTGTTIPIRYSTTFCQTTYPAYKAYMFQLETAEEDAVVVSNVLKNITNDTNFCLGLHDVHQNSTWMWMASNETLTYSNWYPGEPTVRSMGQYYVFVSTYDNYRWWDDFGHYKCQPVCEISLI